ncbi:hypothetical protein [Staphylococcus equorum]|uniref:Uncharacterized protein n=1 Tax=Staphylococcus equorum TaxID=246432 RepID=A0A9X4LBE7_9STAP|nr:hypothetical protein [Staphylococcus equorum]MDG0860347.1 hypothetical protein [Staphylococcus equorum]
METMTFEKKTIDTLTVTNQSIKEHEVLSAVLEQECDIATKKSPNRPWLYLKDKKNLKTFGGIRMNKNSIGTFYINTKFSTILEDTLFGVISKTKEEYISNKIAINDLKGLKKMIALINNLNDENQLYEGKYS